MNGSFGPPGGQIKAICSREQIRFKSPLDDSPERLETCSVAKDFLIGGTVLKRAGFQAGPIRRPEHLSAHLSAVAICKRGMARLPPDGETVQLRNANMCGHEWNSADMSDCARVYNVEIVELSRAELRWASAIIWGDFYV